ncbi:hypothetical protein SDC9_84618 [bioreactor metagenome]|uniref:Methyl-accepting transducer domain-containing protein n=1 Tax=bioreactor metagenome TaxID=1076179 RepID=A0A644ZAR6_9ZZZZ
MAEEVRNLAGQSAKAAKETTDLIENSIKKVEAGTKIANNTAGALLKIVEGISRASDLVDNIASASNEQSAALVQINQGIIQVSQVVQTNAAAAEESAAASEELSSQAESLKKNVSAFKLSTGSMLLSTENTDHQIAERIKEPDRQSEKKHKTNVALKTNISLTENNFGKY